MNMEYLIVHGFQVFEIYTKCIYINLIMYTKLLCFIYNYHVVRILLNITNNLLTESGCGAPRVLCMKLSSPYPHSWAIVCWLTHTPVHALLPSLVLYCWVLTLMWSWTLLQWPASCKHRVPPRHDGLLLPSGYGPDVTSACHHSHPKQVSQRLTCTTKCIIMSLIILYWEGR